MKELDINKFLFVRSHRIIQLIPNLGLKGVRYDLKTHLRAMKILALTIFCVLSSKITLLSRYNLLLISYEL